MKKETLGLLREFKKQWYPARNVRQIKDFIAWLERKGYEVIKSKNLKEINIIAKINRQWKDGLITEYQFSKNLDQLLVNIKKHLMSTR